MSIKIKNKVATAVIGAFVLASAPAAATNLLSGADLEAVTGFNSGNSGFNNGPLLTDGTPAYIGAANGKKSGWCRFIDKTRTQTVKNAAGSEAIPAGNDSNVVAFCNHNRNDDIAGLGRKIEGMQAGKMYALKGDGATKGQISWGFTYFKTGEEVFTVVNLPNTVVSDGAWVSVSDEFTVPDDIDTAKEFTIFMHTAPSDTYSLTGDISVTERSLLWTDNYEMTEVLSGADTDEDGVADYEDAFPENPAAAVDTDGDGMPDDFLASCDQACIDASGLVADDDDDNDGVLDVNDGYPTDDMKSVKIVIGPEDSQAISGESFTIDASETVPNASAAAYSWTQISGTAVELSEENGNATFVAPVVSMTEDAVFELTVVGEAETASATHTVKFKKAPSVVTANATISGMAASDGMTLAAGEIITLDATSSTDSEGFDLSYSWKAKGAPITLVDANMAVATFEVPAINIDKEVTFTVTVTNNETDDETGELLGTTDTFEIVATVAKDEAPKPSGGSLGWLTALLLGGLVAIRRKVLS